MNETTASVVPLMSAPTFFLEFARGEACGTVSARASTCATEPNAATAADPATPLPITPMNSFRLMFIVRVLQTLAAWGAQLQEARRSKDGQRHDTRNCPRLATVDSVQGVRQCWD